MAGKISVGACREVAAAMVERYRQAGRRGKGMMLDELCSVTGWHRKHAVRALAGGATQRKAQRPRRRIYGESIRDALIALWEASDRLCGKRLKVIIPVLLPALERHGGLRLKAEDRALVRGISAATIDRLLSEIRAVARGGTRRARRLLFRCPPRGAGTHVQRLE